MLIKIMYLALAVCIVLSPLSVVGTTNISDDPVVLITGFEPFDGYEINPSLLIAEAFNGSMIGDAEIIGLVLPVEFDTSVDKITQAIEMYQPIVVLGLGLDAQTNTIDVEKVGLNLKRYPKGEVPLWFIPRIISFGHPLLKLSPLKTKDIVDELTVVDIPAQQSFFAGTYVCNAAFYGTLDYIDEQELLIQSGFVHVPLLDTQDPEGMPLEMMINATSIIVEHTLR